MTYLDKYMELHPHDAVGMTMIFDCPDDYFYNARSLCEEEGHGRLKEICPRCWKQEYKGEEVK